MKQENQNARLCFICHNAPVNRICLNEDCIKDQIYLFCDGCRKNQKIRKYATEIYEIDAFSFPFCLFSINSANKQKVLKVQQCVLLSRECLKQNSIQIYDSLSQMQKTLQRVIQLSQTFDSQKAEQNELFLKLPLQEKNQVLKKVQTLKWLKQNKQLIQNSSSLSQKISDFSQSFNSGLSELSDKIQAHIKQFCDKFNLNNFFTESKKTQKPAQRSKQNAIKGKNSKISKTSAKTFDVKSRDKFSQVNQNSSSKKVNINFNQNSPSQLMDLEQSKKSWKNQQILKPLQPYQNGEGIQSQISPINQPVDISGEKKQKKGVQKKSLDNKKKRSKPNLPVQKQIIEEQIKGPLLILSKVPTKQDYQENEKLIVNLRNIASIIWSFDQSKKSTPENQLKNQNMNFDKSQEDEKSVYFQIHNQKIQKINLDKIKYLQIQELPKSQKQIFHVIIEGKQTQVVYSWFQFQGNVEQMINLEQIHIFTTLMFQTEQQFLSIFFSSPSLKVISFNCLNPASFILETYKNLIDGKENQELKILQIAGNIPFCQNLQLYDLKAFYPESEKNKKIYDGIFAQNYQDWINKQLQSNQQEFNKKQDLPHKNSCWFFKEDNSLLQRQRFQIKLTQENNKTISKCFSELRNCWIPILSKEQLKNIQENRNLNKIQHLTFGYHQVKLQVIPQYFFFEDEAFSKSLNNLKSLNLVSKNIFKKIDLIINELFMKQFFGRQGKQLESLKIEFCLGLKNSFYSNLPKYCPKLKKISINTIKGQIDGDFIFNLLQLETIILPWSEIQYKGLSNSNGHAQNHHHQVQSQIHEKDFIEQEGQFQRLHYKKWKYINIYGCNWFHTDFFALINLETIQHLNIGKCSYINIMELMENLKNCGNLESLCLDELPIENKELFEVLVHLPKLKRLSVAHCPNLNFRVGKLSSNQVQLLDQMTHLDLRNHFGSIDSSYTLEMKNPKYIVISRPFDVEPNQLLVLTQRQIYASYAKL